MTRIFIGIALAIAITAALDISGLTMFSALPLIGLFLIFALLDKLSRAEVGLRLGRPGYYGLALGHPILVMAVLGGIAYFAGALDLAKFDLVKVLANIALLSGATFIVAIITEEGFFRGWLWGAATKHGASPVTTLALTTAAFVAWHIPFVAFSGEFHFGASDVPVFFLNATLIGLVWGLLRLGSGSIIVSSAGHGLWNGLAYVLFGIGSGVGALGIEEVGLYGPEVGLYAVGLNAASAAFLLFLFRDRLTAGQEEKLA